MKTTRYLATGMMIAACLTACGGGGGSSGGSSDTGSTNNSGNNNSNSNSGSANNGSSKTWANGTEVESSSIHGFPNPKAVMSVNGDKLLAWINKDYQLVVMEAGGTPYTLSTGTTIIDLSWGLPVISREHYSHTFELVPMDDGSITIVWQQLTGQASGETVIYSATWTQAGISAPVMISGAREFAGEMKAISDGQNLVVGYDDDGDLRVSIKEPGKDWLTGIELSGSYFAARDLAALEMDGHFYFGFVNWPGYLVRTYNFNIHEVALDGTVTVTKVFQTDDTKNSLVMAGFNHEMVLAWSGFPGTSSSATGSYTVKVAHAIPGEDFEIESDIEASIVNQQSGQLMMAEWDGELHIGWSRRNENDDTGTWPIYEAVLNSDFELGSPEVIGYGMAPEYIVTDDSLNMLSSSARSVYHLGSSTLKTWTGSGWNTGVVLKNEVNGTVAVSSMQPSVALQDGEGVAIWCGSVTDSSGIRYALMMAEKE